MNNINDLQEQFENLIKQGQELIEKLKEERVADASKTKRWKPKDGEIYHYIVSNGEIDYSLWMTHVVDKERFNYRNVFKTKEEAQKELDRRLAEQELLDMCDWDGDSVYFIIFNKNIDTFDTDSYNAFIPTPYCFSSEESCQKAIDTLGTEKLKLIFRID